MNGDHASSGYHTIVIWMLGNWFTLAASCSTLQSRHHHLQLALPASPESQSRGWQGRLQVTTVSFPYSLCLHCTALTTRAPLCNLHNPHCAPFSFLALCPSLPPPPSLRCLPDCWPRTCFLLSSLQICMCEDGSCLAQCP